MDAYYVHIPEGKIFVDEDGTLYQGSYDEDHGYVDYPGIKPSGKTLRPYKAITIANNADNSTTISKWNGGVAEVTLSGRTLYKDGDLNTLCLPFAISNFEGTPLEGATVKELLSTSNLAAGVLTLNFSDDEDTQTTGIIGHTDSTDFTDKADAIYDLQGRKVEKPKNGLYIVNGKKVVIK